MNTRAYCGTTPLFSAAQNGHSNIVSLLTKVGGDVNARREGPVVDGDFFKTNLKSLIGPLQQSCDCGHFDVARQLIAAGCDLNAQSSHFGFTALHYACQNVNINSIYYKLAKLLLSSRCELNIQSFICGSTGLHLAVGNSNIRLVRLLVATGFDVDVSDASGKTSLHLASDRGSCEIVRLLLRRGCRVCSTANVSISIMYYLTSQENDLFAMCLV